jgi:hypothetical protein
MTGAWLIEDTPDELDTAAAEDILGDVLGRFACGLCADNRDAAERAEREVKELAQELERAQAVLRVIMRTQMRPAEREAPGDTPHELALIGFSKTLAGIRARIEIYFQAAGAARKREPAL